MKSILMSIKPKWVEKIASGEKTVEVRKSVPKCGTPFKVYIYCTKEKYVEDLLHYCNDETGVHYKANGKVVGEFVCDRVMCYSSEDIKFFDPHLSEESCVSKCELLRYKGDEVYIYGLHISDLKIYNKPKELSEFKHEQKCFYSKKRCIGKPCEYKPDCLIYTNVRVPQSWCYVEEL